MRSESLIEKFSGSNFNPEGVPEELKQYDQWVVWSLFEGNDKKPTYLSKGGVKPAKWGNHDNQYSFEKALEIYQSHEDFHGLGFVLSESDPFVGIDFDKLTDDDDRHRWYQETNTWSEISQSGKGIHMFVKGELPKAFKPSTGEVEIYSKGRVIAMTGNLTSTNCLTVQTNQELIDQIKLTYCAEKDLDKIRQQNQKFVLPDEVGEGSRDNTMYQYCCSLFAKGLNEGEVLVRSLKANKINFLPPLGKEQVLAKVENAKVFFEEQENRDKKEIIAKLNRTNSHNAALASRFIFLRESGKILDVHNKVQMSIVSFNQSMEDVPTEAVDSKGKPKLEMVSPSHYLKTREDYKVVDGLGWMPIPYGQELNEKYLYIQNQGCTYVNKWRGFAITPQRGNVRPWINRLKTLIPCKKARKTLIRRMAIDIQRPHLKANWQIVIYGGYGVGKDSILRPFQQIFGEAFKSMDGSSAVGDYDDELVGTKVLLINEVENLGRDAKSNTWLKRNSCSEGAGSIMLNPKKEAKVLQANVSSLYLLSNESDCLKCDEHERRYYVIESTYREITAEQKLDYFDNWLDKNGASHLFEFLMRVDISKIDPFTLPERTKAFYDMSELSRADWENVLQNNMETNSGSFAFDALSCRKIIERDLHLIKYLPKESSVNKWLKKRGFEKIPLQPAKSINGKKDKKSRSWLFNPNKLKNYQNISAKDWWEFIDQAEEIDVGFHEI